MNEPVNIRPDQVTYKEKPQEPIPSDGINPTPENPGLTYTKDEPTPTISVKLDQPTTLTVIYVPNDRPNEPSNVNTFTVVFTYPNETKSREYPSSTAGSTTTTTTPSGVPSLPQTTPTTPGVQPPSPASPKVDLEPNFYVPPGTVITFTITSTTDDQPPTGVRIILVLSIFYLFETLY